VHCGVHYPTDVLVGSVWGLLTAELWMWTLPALRHLDPGTVGGRACALGSPVLVAAVALVLCYRRAARAARAQPDPPCWREHACRGKYASRSLEPHAEPLAAYVGMLGVLTGLALGQSGLLLLPPLPYPPTARLCVRRALLGNVGLIIIFEGIGACTPRKPHALYAALRFVKYTVVPVYILVLAPPLFRAVGF
jgi:hypothetical protein